MTSPTRFQHRMTQTALVLALLTIAGIVVQIFLAGLALFDNASRWADHKTFGMMLGPLVILLTLAVLLARPSRSLAGMGVALLVLYIVQINLPNASPGWVAALHPLVGLSILGLPIAMAQRLTNAVRTRPAPAPAGAPTSSRHVAPMK